MKKKKLFWLPLLLLLVVSLQITIMKNYRTSSSSSLSSSSLLLLIGVSEVEEEEDNTQHHQQQQQQKGLDLLLQLPSPPTSRLCSNEELIHGRWNPITMERPPYIPLSPRVRCMSTTDFYKPFNTYKWERSSSSFNHNENDQNQNDQKEEKHSTATTSSRCHFVDWDATKFIHLLSNQTITFVGDSLSLEHYASLVHLLGDRARLPPKAVQHKRIQRNICTTNSDRNQQQQQQQQQHDYCVQVVFKTDFPLHNLREEIVASLKADEEEEEANAKDGTSSSAPTKRENPTPPSVLVLNRGAHYVPDDELISSLQQQTLPAIKLWNDQYCSHRHRQRQSSSSSTTTTPFQLQECILIWRTTVPGHPYCTNFTKPATNVQEMQQYIEETSTRDSTGAYRKGEYHWQDFARQNQLVVSLLQQKWEPILTNVKIHIMDSYSINILRPDYHRTNFGDCLHSCSPGGGNDLNSQWLFHIILRERERERKSKRRKGKTKISDTP